MSLNGSTTFRIAGAADVPGVRGFIDAHWRSGHVLARDESLLRWQHLDPDGTLNFVLAERDGSLLGILGFIDQGLFDPPHRGESVSLTTWVARTDVPTTGVGTGLVRHLVRALRPALTSTIGVAVPAQSILAALGHRVGTMDHHAVLNPSLPRFDVARVARATFAEERHGSSVTWIGDCSNLPDTTTALFDLHNASFLPAKSPDYLAARFARHPRYHYRAIEVSAGGRATSLLVCRTIDVGGRSVVRCVDAVGSLNVPGTAAALGDVLAEEGHEYLDVVHHAETGAPCHSAGFAEVGPGTGVELPGFFEPFAAESRVLRFAHLLARDEARRVRLFLADSDQDRPNRPAEDDEA